MQGWGGGQGMHLGSPLLQAGRALLLQGVQAGREVLLIAVRRDLQHAALSPCCGSPGADVPPLLHELSDPEPGKGLRAAAEARTQRLLVAKMPRCAWLLLGSAYRGGLALGASLKATGAPACHARLSSGARTLGVQGGASHPHSTVAGGGRSTAAARACV